MTEDALAVLHSNVRVGTIHHYNTSVIGKKATKIPYRLRETIRAPIRGREMADKVAELTERMTGEKCFVEPYGGYDWLVVRQSGTKRVRA